MSNSSQCVSLVIFKFLGLSPKIKGFLMMQNGHRLMQNHKGLRFYKLLGTGKGNGFNPYPDYSTYALLSIWDDKAYAKSFLDGSKMISKYTGIANETEFFLLETIKSHGAWGGSNPFTVNPETIVDVEQPLAVLTRARIKVSKLRKFWSYVPTSSKPLKNNTDMLYSKGVGEVPFLNMATFSVWKSAEAMKNFAYQSKEHLKAIKMTRELGWYSEELFARFVLLEQGKIQK